MKKSNSIVSHITISLSLLLFLGSCGKQDFTTTISGQVLEFGSNIPIENATVYVYGGEADGNFSNPGLFLETIDSAITDINGFYQFSFDSESYPTLRMDALHQNYFPIAHWTQNIFSTKNNDIDIILDPHAWLELTIKNIAPTDNFDVIYVGNTSGFRNINDMYGSDIDTTVIGLVKGNDPDLKVIWFANSEGFNEKKYCPALDTTRFEILY